MLYYALQSSPLDLRVKKTARRRVFSTTSADFPRTRMCLAPLKRHGVGTTDDMAVQFPDFRGPSPLSNGITTSNSTTRIIAAIGQSGCSRPIEADRLACNMHTRGVGGDPVASPNN